MHTPKCVMIIDDEPNVRLMLRTALELSGYRVVEAADGLAALRCCATPRATSSCSTCGCRKLTAWRPFLASASGATPRPS